MTFSLVGRDGVDTGSPVTQTDLKLLVLLLPALGVRSVCPHAWCVTLL